MTPRIQNYLLSWQIDSVALFLLFIDICLEFTTVPLWPLHENKIKWKVRVSKQYIYLSCNSIGSIKKVSFTHGSCFIPYHNTVIHINGWCLTHPHFDCGLERYNNTIYRCVEQHSSFKYLNGENNRPICIVLIHPQQRIDLYSQSQTLRSAY